LAHTVGPSFGCHVRRGARQRGAPAVVGCFEVAVQAASMVADVAR
jgi:hypothetical protein